MKPYKDSDRLLIDVQQIIPLPEAEQYQIKIREKKAVERTSRIQNRDFTRFDITVGEKTIPDLPKRRAIFEVIRHLCEQGVDPEAIRRALPSKGNALRCVEGDLNAEAFESALAAQFVGEGNKPATRRYFIDDDELIHANGKTYSVTKMWGSSTVPSMDTLIERFPGYGIAYAESL